MQEREGEEDADDQTEHEQQRIEHAPRGFRRPVGVRTDIFAEEDVERRHGAARQQVVLGDAEEVDLRQADEPPMAEEHRQHDIDPLGEGEHQADGEDRHRAGHDGHGHHRERTSQGQRAEGVEERHGQQQRRECVVPAGALERGVPDAQVVDPDAAHNGPEEGQHTVVLAWPAVDHIVGIVI